MGQELTGLIASVEDAFGFAIPDEDAETLNTVGELHDYVLSHRYGGKQETCMTGIIFYRLRRGLMWVLHVEREDVRALMDVTTLIPSRRFRTWHALQKAIGLRLPQLRRPAWVMKGALGATFAMAIAVPALLSFGLLNGAILVGLLTAFAAGHCICWLTIPLATELQSDCTTVGQLATATLARNYRAIVEEACKRADNGEVWNMLRTIVAERLGIPFHNITRETNLHQNLVAA